MFTALAIVLEHDKSGAVPQLRQGMQNSEIIYVCMRNH